MKGNAKRRQICFRTRDALAAELKAAARQSGRSVSEEIENWLEHMALACRLAPILDDRAFLAVLCAMNGKSSR